MSNLPKNFFDCFVNSMASTAYEIEKDLEGLMESPIETALGTALHLCLRSMGYPVRNAPNYAVRPVKLRTVWVVAPQQKVGDYRVDMIVGWWVDDDYVCVAVECDGHAFHERTKEQASRDRKKDRDLQSIFPRVLRFTGSDIHRDAFACAEEIVLALVDLQNAGMTQT